MSQHEETPQDTATIEELVLHEGEFAEPKGLHPFWIVLIICAIAGLSFVMFDGADSETYFFEVDKAVAQSSKIKGKVIRIKGKVEPGSIIRTKGKLGTTFRIAAKGQSILVHYDKAMPDTFEEDREIVAQGMVSNTLEMTADEVVVKCPSRYEEQAPTQGGQSKERASLK